jgi:hypothetical protein
MKVDELFPGDIVREIEDGIEFGRYLVINRRIQHPNAQYYYIEYSCIILYYNGKLYDRPEKVGTWWIIDSINLNSPRENWEVVVRSGLSWKDNERKEETKT